MLQGKHILVGVTGGIAAYKAALLVRELIKGGAHVKVIMTKGACDLLPPHPLRTFKIRVYTEFFNPQTGEWNNHVDLGLWADAFIVAPATANAMGKNGRRHFGQFAVRHVSFGPLPRICGPGHGFGHV